MMSALQKSLLELRLKQRAVYSTIHNISTTSLCCITTTHLKVTIETSKTRYIFDLTTDENYEDEYHSFLDEVDNLLTTEHTGILKTAQYQEVPHTVYDIGAVFTTTVVLANRQRTVSKTVSIASLSM